MNGVFIFTAISDYGLDAFFPKAFGSKTNVKYVEIDQCLGSSDTDSTYRYYMYSPCMFSGVSLRSQAKLCRNEKNYELCHKNPTWHALAYTPAQVKTIHPIGLAKDGKVIYGPYRADGELWGPCDVDICNGRNFDATHYGYVATMFFPYTVGCWGPGNRVLSEKDKVIAAQCSTKPRICYSFESFANSLNSIVVFGIAAMSMVSAFIF